MMCVCVCVCVCWVGVIERKRGVREREREQTVWAALVGAVVCGYPGVNTNSAYPLPLWTLAMSCVFHGPLQCLVCSMDPCNVLCVL